MMRKFSIVFLALLATVLTASAQEIRSTITGRVTDSTDAVLPHAQVQITDTDTGATAVIVTNAAGVYSAPFLNPGTYEIRVSVVGFKNYIHTGLVVQSEQMLTENIRLDVGSNDESITVSASTPLIDVTTANTGQELTAEEVSDLPSNGRSPLAFAHIEYGVVSKGKHSESQVTPFGNSTADDFSLGGGSAASNELLLNGVPNMEDSGRTAGFSPELDAVNAVHVDEFSANAAIGDTAGGVVNITTKSGTNQLHGTLSEYYNGSRPFTAKPYFTTAGATVDSTHFNQYGATVGGPIYLPHLIRGKDKLFFFFAYEGYKGSAPATTIASVPTQAERNGDFSSLTSYSSSDQLYNPWSGTMNSKGVVTRTIIPGNILSNAGLSVNSVAAAYMNMMPLPNYSGASTKADGENNYFASDPTTNDYYSEQARVDYNVSNANKVFFEFHRSHYDNAASNVFHNNLTGTSSYTNLLGGQIDDVHSFNSSLNLENRLGFSRYETWGGPNSLGMNPTSVGMPGYMASNSNALALPYMTFSDTSSIPSLSSNPASTEYYDNIQYFASLTKIVGRHILKVGPDIRSNKKSTLNLGAANGQFAFTSATGDYVTANSSSAKQGFGGALALFELGVPSSGTYSVNSAAQYDNWYTAYFAQDDWKATHNLNVSMGIRIEHETPLVESNNKIASYWDPNMTNAVTASSLAAYTASPSSMLAASSFSATGGLVYANSSHRSPYSTALVYASPRIGFSYAPDFAHGTLAIRGGAGIYVNPFGDYYSGSSYGYSQSTAMTIGNIAGTAPGTTLSNPFPTTATSTTAANPIQTPYGSTYGINTQLGSSMSYYASAKVGYSEKWSLDIQKQFGKNWLIEVGFFGAHSVHSMVADTPSNTPLLAYYSHSAEADSTVTTEMKTSVTNPFYGLMPTNASATSLNTSKTVTNATILQSHPEYSSLTESMMPFASSNFDSLLARVSKQLSQGLQFTLNYEWSRQLGNATILNTGASALQNGLWYGETTSDFPQHLSVYALYDLPFGSGRLFFNHSKLFDRIGGGWKVTGMYQYLSGTPDSWGNAIYTGNWHDFNNQPHKTNGPSFNTSKFDTTTADQPNSYNWRTFPQYLLRSDPTNNFDFSIQKNLLIGQRVVIQPRVDAFNALNHPQFSAPNVSPTSSSFGYISSQLNSNRSLQGGIHINF
ncbi:carboxypeptidase regulatory-like domain-containing protein [Telmatobacter bradus]|uniref:carboxypeptidase-like regulatory domain-containing protein n=1 Tax=Telmatobacter bradus TaxID=474953 RepID=UPI003B4300E9